MRSLLQSEGEVLSSMRLTAVRAHSTLLLWYLCNNLPSGKPAKRSHSTGQKGNLLDAPCVALIGKVRGILDILN